MKSVLSIIIAFAWIPAASAAYTETMDPNGPARNLKDYAIVDDGGRSDQSDKFQKAIDEISGQGGGRLIVPKGTYALTKVALKSNTHLLLEAGTVLLPFKFKNSGDGKWLFELGREGPVENVSIRGLGGRFTVSMAQYTYENRVRAISCGDVTNFLISDMNVRDNFTVFSSIILSTPETDKKGFVGPTDGTIKDCSTFNANIGYGLAQAHAAKSVLFENLCSLGGVAMRLECGVRPKNPETENGIFDVEGRNIKCENGYVALLLSPHSTKCGVVKVDGIEAISCEFSAKFTNGFISARKKHEGDQPGSFADGTTIKNIRSAFGNNAQRSALHLKYTPVELRESVVQDRPGSLKGPAITAILDQANYSVVVENLTAEGYRNIKPVITKDDAFTGNVLKAWSKNLTAIVKGAGGS